MLAFISMVGQCLSLAGTEVYSDPPHYYRGNGFALGAAVIGTVTAGILKIHLHRRNMQKHRDTDTGHAWSQRAMSIEEIGSDHPDYFFFV
jgi:hypothetical protein